MDYEENLCYCYDDSCDLDRSPQLTAQPEYSDNPFIETRQIFFPNGTIAYQNVQFFKVKSYVGVMVPKYLGGKILEYQICYESIRLPGNLAPQANCTSGKMALFGTL